VAVGSTTPDGNRKATKIADLDPSGAYLLTYDAARKSVAGALLMDGHRVLCRRSHLLLNPDHRT
jgi:hypothetical protein